MRLDTIVGYTYRADTYCPEHIVHEVVKPLRGLGLSTDTEEALDFVARFRGIDRYDESSYDSGEFPKVIFADSADDQDDHCGKCGRRLV